MPRCRARCLLRGAHGHPQCLHCPCLPARSPPTAPRSATGATSTSGALLPPSPSPRQRRRRRPTGAYAHAWFVSCRHVLHCPSGSRPALSRSNLTGEIGQEFLLREADNVADLMKLVDHTIHSTLIV